MTKGIYCRMNKKTTTSEIRSLDIRHFDKKHFIKTGMDISCKWDDGGSLELRIYPDRLILTNRAQIVFLDKTNCNYGGFRYWFKCPECNRRSEVLYNKDSKYLCRQCHELPYMSQREGEIDRLVRKMRKIRWRLGASSNITTPIRIKPKGMHWKTFYHLVIEEMNLSQKYAQAVFVYIGFNKEYFCQ